MKKKRFLNAVFIVAILLYNVALYAQDEEDEGPEGPPSVPINKFLLILTIIGISYGWYVVSKKKNLATTKSNEREM